MRIAQLPGVLRQPRTLQGAVLRPRRLVACCAYACRTAPLRSALDGFVLRALAGLAVAGLPRGGAGDARACRCDSASRIGFGVCLPAVRRRVRTLRRLRRRLTRQSPPTLGQRLDLSHHERALGSRDGGPQGGRNASSPPAAGRARAGLPNAGVANRDGSSMPPCPCSSSHCLALFRVADIPEAVRLSVFRTAVNGWCTMRRF